MSSASEDFSSVDMFPGKMSVYGACRQVSSYERLNRIGEGAYGTVYRAVDKQTNRLVALKKVILHNEKQDGFPLTSLREIQLLKRVSHPSCVRLLDVVVGRRREMVFLVFEYCEHDLAGLLDSIKKPFSESDIKCIMLQLLEAIEYLHSLWIIHRDLKMSNLLYNNQGQLKLADFGLARTFGHPVQPMTPKVVTLWYRCPELLLGCDTYSTAIDLWAAGCILGELLLGKPLMPGKTDLDQVTKIFKLLGAPNERIWPSLPDLPNVRSGKIDVLGVPHRYNTLVALLPNVSKGGVDLLNEMLTYDPDKRLSARKALLHEYFLSKPLPKSKDVMPTFPTRHGPEPATLKAVNGQGKKERSSSLALSSSAKGAGNTSAAAAAIVSSGGPRRSDLPPTGERAPSASHLSAPVHAGAGTTTDADAYPHSTVGGGSSRSSSRSRSGSRGSAGIALREEGWGGAGDGERTSGSGVSAPSKKLRR